MLVEKIYFDMDDVLADFTRGVKEMVGMTPPPQDDKHKAEDNDMWAGIRKIEHFYDKLEIAPGAKKMFDALYGKYGNKCEVLTAVPKEDKNIPEAGEDKIKWMHRMLSEDIKINVVTREEKPGYCFGLGCILIDDMEKNIKNWEEIGGTGVLHKSAEETMLKLKEMGVL